MNQADRAWHWSCHSWGSRWLVNHSRRFRRFWEYYLCFVVRGKVVVFEFEALKD